jgi:hypothetical protein
MLGLGEGLGLGSAAGGGSPPAPDTYRIELEDASGDLLLEAGDYLLLEDAP